MELIECFPSIDGEVSGIGQGRMSYFIRMANCCCSCQYCDVPDKKSKFTATPEELTGMVIKSGITKVTITGGEPLLQRPELSSLCRLLNQNNILVSVETSGAIPLEYKDAPINDFLFFVDSVVMDYKLPSSGEQSKMNIDWTNDLTEEDFLKFVVGTKEDYEMARELSRQVLKRDNPPFIAFSPVFGPASLPTIDAKWLLEQMIKDKLDCFLSIQVHKCIGIR